MPTTAVGSMTTPESAEPPSRTHKQRGIAGAVGEALHGLPEGLVRTTRDRYLQGAEDITTTLDALYERATGEVTSGTERYESDRTG